VRGDCCGPGAGTEAAAGGGGGGGGGGEENIASGVLVRNLIPESPGSIM
jgi:hypothetical protein